MQKSDLWNFLSLGLLLLFLGTLTIFWFSTRLESLSQNSVSLPILDDIKSEPENIQELDSSQNQALMESQEINDQLQKDLEALTHEIQLLVSDKQKQEENALKAYFELEQNHHAAYLQLEQQQGHIIELQETIANQKTILEKRQQQITILETKVSDLTYEIKTLLQLAEAHSGSLYSDLNPSPTLTAPPMQNNDPSIDEDFDISSERQIHSSIEASFQLKRCLDIAQKITGSHRFNSQLNAFLNSPADSFALDLRRLCDSLRSENSGSILLYSPKENLLLFANNQIKLLTGWSPEKFVQNFSEILKDESSWKQGLASLAMRSEAQIKLSLKARSGNNLQVQANLGMIPTGIFRNHAIAILYNANFG